jgi:thiol-disulfide isomerase/thioredoxin
MRDVNGKIKKISNLRGKYTLLEFWASWCGPCRRQNKSLVKIYKTYNSKGLNIIGISLDDNKKNGLKL